MRLSLLSVLAAVLAASTTVLAQGTNNSDTAIQSSSLAETSVPIETPTSSTIMPCIGAGCKPPLPCCCTAPDCTPCSGQGCQPCTGSPCPTPTPCTGKDCPC